MAKKKKKSGRRKTKGVPVLATLGTAYGTVLQPAFGGGFNNATNSGVGGFKAGGIKQGAKEFLLNLGENFSSVNFETRKSNFSALGNGPGAIIAGVVGDEIAGFIKLKKVINRGLKALGTKYRWAA